MSSWRIRRGDRGWLTYHWVHPDGRECSAYPIPLKWYWAPLYPWMVYTSIRSIIEHRRLM